MTQFRTIHKTTLIGFDEIIRRIHELEKPQSGFPPYDIVRVSNEEFFIKLAVAGFSKDDISVVLNEGKLTVKGSIKTDKSETDYIYKGIAERDFSREFALADTIEVKKVSLSDGILLIELVNVIPEHKKPKIFKVQ